MYKFAKIAFVLVAAALLMAGPAFAQDDTTGSDDTTTAAASAGGGSALISFSGSFGAALVVIGAALGIGKLGSAALEGMARQPEVAGNIQTAMIIAAALIEGFTFYALFICSTSA